MTEREAKAQARAKMARYRERQQAKGLTQVQVWVRPEDAQAVRDYARKLVKLAAKAPLS